ncbi:MAG: inorganic phosphate transporter [Desulfovibrio sp.]|nr:inorganic phosphate transporter [Desulfovibrio sp.]
MFDVPLLLVLIVSMALFFDFTNGAHDCANAVSTIISTKVLSPQVAVIAAAVLNLIGAMLGTAVAKTLGGGIVLTSVIGQNQILVLAALVGAIVWNCITWYYGIPSSSSHALVGGLIGACLATAGPSALNIVGIVQKVIIPLVVAPVSGFCVGFVLLWLVYWLFHRAQRRTVRNIFQCTEFFTAGFLATSHGLNDAQKTMGIVTLALLIFGYVDTVEVPLWVKLACALAMSLGTAVGGWKIIRTMGTGIIKMEPVHGVSTELSATIVITTASMLGAPVSTTHVITSAIVGVGARKRFSMVRWGVARKLLVAWVVTLPASSLVGYFVCQLLMQIF